MIINGQIPWGIECSVTVELRFDTVLGEVEGPAVPIFAGLPTPEVRVCFRVRVSLAHFLTVYRRKFYLFGRRTSWGRPGVLFHAIW